MYATRDRYSCSREIAKTYLVLDEELDTLDRSGGSLRDGSGNTTHCGLNVSNPSLKCTNCGAGAARGFQISEANTNADVG